MNEAADHLEDDIERLCHPDANLEHTFILHLYRFSEGGKQFSGRDWSPNSPKIVTLDVVKKLSDGRSTDIYHGTADNTKRLETGVWPVNDGSVQKP